MLPKGVHIEGVPAEREALLATDKKQKRFSKVYPNRISRVIAIGWVQQNRKIHGK